MVLGYAQPKSHLGSSWGALGSMPNGNIEHSIRTNLIHERVTVATPWWRTATVCDVPGSYEDDDLRRLAKVLPHIAGLGFDAVLLRPADPVVEESLPYLPKFVAKAHRLGLRVISRVYLLPEGAALDPLDSPPLLDMKHDANRINERVRAALDAGCDGVDLGTVSRDANEDKDGHADQVFSESVRLQLAELASFDDSFILTAAFATEPEEFYKRHLEEEWFHHMRNDAIVTSEWDATALQTTLAKIYASHDRVGHTTAWRHSLFGWSHSPAARDSEDVGWMKDAPPARRTAMNLYLASLPGAVYLPFLAVGGSVKVKERAKKPSKLRFSFAKSPIGEYQAHTITLALSLREEEDMAHSHVAFVEGFPWAGGDVAVHLTGPVMVVLNTGDETVFVPREHRLMVSSSPTTGVDSRGTQVPPDTCSWFMPAPPKPVDPFNYR